MFFSFSFRFSSALPIFCSYFAGFGLACLWKVWTFRLFSAWFIIRPVIKYFCREKKRIDEISGLYNLVSLGGAMHGDLKIPDLCCTLSVRVYRQSWLKETQTP